MRVNMDRKIRVFLPDRTDEAARGEKIRVGASAHQMESYLTFWQPRVSTNQPYP